MFVEQAHLSQSGKQASSTLATPRPSDTLNPRHWPVWIGLGACRMLALLPYRPLIFLGRGLGLLSFFVNGQRRRRTARNLTLFLPKFTVQERQCLLRQNFTAYGIGTVERLMGWWWPAARLRHLINHVEGLQHLRAAATEGRGVLLLGLHTTTMEVGFALIRTLQAVDGSYLPDTNPVYNWTQLRARSRADRHGSVVESNNVREMLRRLRAGHAIWHAPDRFYPDKPSVLAPLFGVPVPTIAATSKLARLAGASVITYEVWRDPGGGYSLRIDAPIPDFPGNDPVVDCTRINAWIERAVMRHPDQYRWAHKRIVKARAAPAAQREPPSCAVPTTSVHS